MKIWIYRNMGWKDGLLFKEWKRFVISTWNFPGQIAFRVCSFCVMIHY